MKSGYDPSDFTTINRITDNMHNTVASIGEEYADGNFDTVRQLAIRLEQMAIDLRTDLATDTRAGI